MLTSNPYIFAAPYSLAACITASPTAPRPQTATDDPGFTTGLIIAAPQPVLIPHPRTQHLLRSALGLILAAEIYAITVYSLNVLHPMK
jgi:hypothetical protein